jgi:hypothetical protein
MTPSFNHVLYHDLPLQAGAVAWRNTMRCGMEWTVKQQAQLSGSAKGCRYCQAFGPAWAARVKA